MQEALLILLFISFLVTMVSATPSKLGISLPGCPDKCGNVSIPYPFGIGASCAATNLNSYFALICNNSFQPPRPMFGDSPIAVEVIDISLERGEARVYGLVSYSCFTSNTTSYNYAPGLHGLEITPFIISTRNHFTVIGCNTLWLIGGTTDNSSDLHVAGCYSYCEGIKSTSDGAPCTGTGCCETAISSNLIGFKPFTTNESSVWEFNPCSYAMLAEAGWYSFRSQDLIGYRSFIHDRAPRGAPVVMDWAIRNGSCPKDGAKAPEDYACVSPNSYCVNLYYNVPVRGLTKSKAHETASYDWRAEIKSLI